MVKYVCDLCGQEAPRGEDLGHLEGTKYYEVCLDCRHELVHRIAKAILDYVKEKLGEDG